MSGPAGTAVELWHGLDRALSGVDRAVDGVCRVLAWPLIQLVDLVDGEPAALRAKATEWEALAAQVRELAVSHRRVREAEQAGWRSPAGAAYGRRLAEVERRLLDTAEQFTATAEYLRGVADALETVHDVLVDICVEFVNFLLVTLVTALLMAPFTAGASWVAGVALGVTRGMIALARMLKVIRPLAAHLQKVVRLLQRVLYHLRRLRNHLDRLVDRQKALRTGQRYADKRRDAGTPDRWFHTFLDPAKGTWKLGRSGSPFDMSAVERLGVLRAHGAADGARRIGRDWATNLPWNLPNSVVHGVTWGTTAVASGLSVPGSEQIGDRVEETVRDGADWVDENVFGQPPGERPTGR